MTGNDLLTILCQFINKELKIKAIKGPSNNSAPEERPYVTVYLQNVRQVGDRFIPGPVRGAQAPIFIDGGNVAATGEAATGDVPVRKYKAVMQVANVQFYGVEDDGEALRKIRNALQSDEFDSFVAAHVTLNRGATGGGRRRHLSGGAGEAPETARARARRRAAGGFAFMASCPFRWVSPHSGQV